MSAVPRLVPPATSPAGGTARLGFVYGYDVRDAVTGAVQVCDYIGQTRDLARRDGQHRGRLPQRDGVVREQPWADLIVGGPYVLASGVWTDAELDAVERRLIAQRRPRLNHKDNESNPDRIPIYVQRQQRDARDLAAGLQPRDWARAAVPHRSETARRVPNRPGTTPGGRQDSPTFAKRVGAKVFGTVRRKTVAALKWLAPWAVLWLALTVAGLVWAPMPAGDVPGTALFLTAAAGVGWRHVTKPNTRHTRRANRRRGK